MRQVNLAPGVILWFGVPHVPLRLPKSKLAAEGGFEQTIATLTNSGDPDTVDANADDANADDATLNADSDGDDSSNARTNSALPLQGSGNHERPPGRARMRCKLPQPSKKPSFRQEVPRRWRELAGSLFDPSLDPCGSA